MVIYIILYVVVNKYGKMVIYIVFYIAYLLITRKNENYIASIKKDLKKGFEMTNLGYLHYYLCIETTQNSKCIFISKKKYIGEMLNKFGMDKFNPLSTPME
jgi:hypothetical protein